MDRLLISVLIILSVSCTSKNAQKYSPGTLVAWNEDAAHSITIIIYNNGSFEFSIKTPTHTDIATGKIKYTGDTLYLVYKDSPPASLGNMLIEEPSGNYLIQLASSNHPRLVLRIQRRLGSMW